MLVHWQGFRHKATADLSYGCKALRYILFKKTFPTKKSIDKKFIKCYNTLMIKETDRKTIYEISKKYHVKRVVLFGSCTKQERESRDIDIAVEGLTPKDFYSYYGDLMFSLSKPVDIIDLSGISKFNKLIQKEGVVLYG
ncbi:MAG: hypothetical protein P9M13_10330 [Candidatus Ancaeobacter aquaticus]|nr:hypothetical protein [Candidatus Ancaeobacter aquaticus]